MKPTPRPDAYQLLAAVGWLELGNAREALRELDALPDEVRQHHVVLDIEWTARSRLGQWEECVRVGAALVKAAPKRPTGWIHHAFALHELKRTQEARDVLLPAARRFPKNELIAYNLACYACQLGDRTDTLKWLTKAMDLKGAEVIKLRALEDPDFEPMREEIRRL